MTDQRRLIEVAFPLKQASLDSVHEKNVRHGHISTLHIWPARRPLAACRAALIATLLPDPGDPAKRKEILERLGGKVVQRVEKKKMPGGKVVERIKEGTVGGILHWGRETENKADLDWFREEIRKAYGGRAPRVLDPFAGGGAIPLEAMRLGCEATAIDINPVAWFILKCTLEYPQKLAGQKRQLPDFVLNDREFMESFFKAQGLKGRTLASQLDAIGLGGKEGNLPGLKAAPAIMEADLAWHVRAWGKWVLDQARRALAPFYPTYAEFEPFDKVNAKPYEPQPIRLVPLKENGTPDIDALNADVAPEITDAETRAEYFASKKNARWLAKPTVAYLWARTVKCKNCRATIPLLKTRWLCKKDNKRVLLTIAPNEDRTGVIFGIQRDVPVVGGNTAQRREHDRRLGQGTMSRAGAWCPCCGKPGTVAMESADIRQEGVSNRLDRAMTAVVTDGPNGKEYRLPTLQEHSIEQSAAERLDEAFAHIPFGVIKEPVPQGASRAGGGSPFTVHTYGMTQWSCLFTPRQLLAIGTFVTSTRNAREAMKAESYPPGWVESQAAYLSLAVDKTTDYTSNSCTWIMGLEAIRSTFSRFALPIVWDFCETSPLAPTAGSYSGALNWVSLVTEHLTSIPVSSQSPTTLNQSAKRAVSDAGFDLVLTDPPYYDAIPYSDLMDFFYVWLRRSIGDLNPQIADVFRNELAPKWSESENDGELIDDASRHGGDSEKSKRTYEDGMARAFQECASALRPDGRMVVVFANKQPTAWETLVSAIIRAGFTVDGSWPIQTERSARVRSLTSAALASSVWLVCKRRSETARPGWDNRVLEDMRSNIHERLRDFWDAGIRGPDFVWAATGPAMEAYSKHPAVKKANEPGKLMEVPEFLRHVRRIVVDFVVGRVLTHGSGGNGEAEAVSGLDDVTTYYLLHRHDFGMEDAPAGAVILYAVSCGLSEKDLADRYDVLARTGGTEAAGETDEEDESGDAEATETEEGSGSTFKLKPWKQRRGKSLGIDAAGRPAPLIDQIHHLMHLWDAGDVVKVDEYLDGRGLRRNQLFQQLLQALIELAAPASQERSQLEKISNHVAAKGAVKEKEAGLFDSRDKEGATTE